MSQNLKRVAILGRPNVGKSSLFNRLIKKRDAITSDMAGTTRDIKRRIAELDESREFELIDTGGIDYDDALFSKVAEFSLKAAKEADIILYMVDGKKAPDEEDKKLFYRLQKLGKPIALVVNKIDNDKEYNERFFEFYSFGAETTLPLSVSHNRYTSDLLYWLKEHIPEDRATLELEEDDFIDPFASPEEMQEEESKEIKVAIIGRVNTGKSSLLNALLKKERSIVTDIDGTTIDPIDESIEHEGYTITFVDTAGIRRRGKIEGIEKYALMRTEEMLKQADIALLVLDATAGVTELDERIAGLIDRYKLGAIIVANKWDIRGEKSYEEMEQEIRDELKFLHYAPLITISAKTGKRVDRILGMVVEIYKRFAYRIPTAALNEMIKAAIRRHHIPSHHGAVVKIKYATQFATKPPRIALVVNHPQFLHFSYKRYLANFIREQIDFTGVPIELIAKKSGHREEDEML